MCLIDAKSKEFRYSIKILMHHMDQFKHTSFANYINFMFEATSALFGPLAKTDFLSKYRLKLVDSNIDFKKQTIVGEKISINVTCSEVKEHYFILNFLFLLENSNDVVLRGDQKYYLPNFKNEDSKLKTTFYQILNQIHD